MFATWFPTILQAASQFDDQGRHVQNVASIQEAIVGLRPLPDGNLRPYDAPGISQLARYAFDIANSTRALSLAADTDPLTGAHIAEAPWSRDAATVAADPQWQVRAEATYLDPAGVLTTGIFTAQFSRVPPATAGSLRRQMTDRINDMLSAPEGTGTPRSGQFVSLGPVTVLAV
jgi:hypothetical protein